MKGLEQIRADETARVRKSKPGRPRSEFPIRYQLRLSEAQWDAINAAAEREDRPLQNWIRHSLDRAARKRSK